MPPVYSRNLRRAVFVLASTALLAACDSSEDRAEEHFQTAVEFADTGDNDRAIVELRNALQLDQEHIEARKLFARISLEQGNMSRAFNQLRAVVEQVPDDLESRLTLAEIAIVSQNWEVAERHGAFLTQASATAEQPEGGEIVDLALRFRNAALDEDEPLIRELSQQAEALYAENPESEILQRVLIEAYVRNGRPDDALEIINQSIEARPDDRRLYDMRLSLLNQQQDGEAIEAELRRMLDVFPEDQDVRANLVRTLIALGRPDEAEDFMRGLIDETERGLGALVSLVAFIRSTDGVDAALTELESAISSRENSEPQLDALRAGLLFDSGERDAGISVMEGLLEQETTDDMANGWKVALARMLLASGNEVGARGRIEEVIANDPTMPEAVKLQAAWQIEADETQSAISALRGALDQAPNDPQLFTLLSQAHARSGESELAEEMLSLAVEASNYAPAQSLAYANTLLGKDSIRAAEDVLINALRSNGNDIRLLDALGGLYLAEEDFARATQVESTLRSLETEQATALADNYKLRILSRREGQDSAVAYLEELVGASEDDTAARIALIRARLAAGENEEALRLAEEFSETQGADDPAGQMVVAAALLATGNLESSEEAFVNVVAEAPENVRAWAQLLRVQNAQGKSDEAEATIEAGLDANPNAPDLLWAKASVAEVKGNIDEAIEIYDELYASLSNSVVVANNLASLLATYRDDEESLERAFVVARRLRGTDVAPFQDTYGWILYRRGDPEQAVTYLEPAAAGLPDDPIVQYHLGRALRDIGRDEDALAAFQRAIDLAGEDDTRAQIADARQAVLDLGGAE